MRFSDFTEEYGRILMLVIVAIALMAVGGCSSGKRDDTDPSDGISGIELFTDNMTGCQYVGWKYRAITPRMDSSGTQVCKKGGA
jgi:hypothetical protein